MELLETKKFTKFPSFCQKIIMKEHLFPRQAEECPILLYQKKDCTCIKRIVRRDGGGLVKDIRN